MLVLPLTREVGVGHVVVERRHGLSVVVARNDARPAGIPGPAGHIRDVPRLVFELPPGPDVENVDDIGEERIVTDFLVVVLVDEPLHRGHATGGAVAIGRDERIGEHSVGHGPHGGVRGKVKALDR